MSSYSPNFSFINLVVHDQTRHGFYVSESATNNLIYGCVVYNNGWRAPDNAEGNGLYIQSDFGTKEMSDNLVFNQSGANIHIYQNSSGGQLVGVTLDGNTAFHAGGIQNVRSYRDWIVGVDSPSRNADNIVFKNNMGYLQPGSSTLTQVQLGRDGSNGTIVVSGNYMPLGLAFNNWSTPSFSGNVFAPQNSDDAVNLQQSGIISATWDNNTYSGPSTGSHFLRNTTSYTRSGWRSATRFDSNSTDAIGTLSGTKVFVRPNRYESGRAHIVVYNWANQSTVAADVSSVLAVGTRYEVRNAQDYFAPPVLSGTFDGQPLQLPMTGLTVAKPTAALLKAPATGPTFNAFVLRSLSSTGTVSAVPGVSLTTPPNGASYAAPADVNLAASVTGASRCVLMGISPAAFQIQSRTTTSGTAVSANSGAATCANNWVRLLGRHNFRTGPCQGRDFGRWRFPGRTSISRRQ